MRICFVITLILAIAHLALATERMASNIDDLHAALSSARPGDIVILRDGQWKNVSIDIAKGGEETKPLTIRAQTPGKTVLTGSSKLKIAAPYVVVDGLLFEGGALTNSDRQLIHFNSDHGQVTNCAIIDYNPKEVATAYYWVFFEGNFNRLDHCLLKGKSHQQPVIGNSGGGSSDTDPKTPSRHNTVDHCHFLDIPHVPNRNGREIFRIWGYGGNEELGDDGAFFTIDSNLFERAHGEGSEIISLKSNRNVVTNNTIRATRGGITNRSGNFNRIENNIILADGQAGASGIRIAGQSHIIRGNYIDGCENGINVMCGEYYESDLTGNFNPILRASAPLKRVPRYGWVREATIDGNTLVNIVREDLLIGSNYKSGWPKSQRVLLPDGLTVADNLIIKPKGGVVVAGATQDRNPPLDKFQFKPNVFEKNTIVGGDDAKVELESAAAGFAKANTRPEQPPVTPLTAKDVGPSWRK